MDTDAIIPLRQRMIEDMTARNLERRTQRSHNSCFGAFQTRAVPARGSSVIQASEKPAQFRPLLTRRA